MALNKETDFLPHKGLHKETENCPHKGVNTAKSAVALVIFVKHFIAVRLPATNITIDSV